MKKRSKITTVIVKSFRNFINRIQEERQYEDLQVINENLKPANSYNNKIIQPLLAQGNNYALFYTEAKNIMHVLGRGIELLKVPVIDIKYHDDSNHESPKKISYLVHEDYIEMELDDSARVKFWQWLKTYKKDPMDIVYIAVSLKKLLATVTSKMAFNQESKCLQIKETIKPTWINWIMFKRPSKLEIAKDYIHEKKLGIRIFYGSKGILQK